MRAHLDRAQNDWAGSNGDVKALDAIRKVIAIGVACGEEHGLPKKIAGDK